MRKVVLWIGMSLDGFTSGPNESIDWLVPSATTAESQAYFRDLRARVDTILLGRVNYEGFFAYWPALKDDPKATPGDRDIARWIDEIPKLVFSQTVREVRWRNARLAGGTAQDEVAALKAAPGKDILIQNSTRLARSLLALGLVDELNLMVAPAAIGGGRPLFTGLPARLDLRMAELTRPFANGTFIARYEVSGRA